MDRFEPYFEGPDALRADANVLGRVVFGARSGRPFIENGVPTLPLNMRGDVFSEAWHSDGDIHSGTLSELVYAHDDEFLFCAGFIPLSERYDEATCRAYSNAFTLVEKLEFARIFRMWNFIPHINEANGDGLEVYRDFCRGRALAFERHGASMPAATGIGTWGDGVGFCFLACRDSAVKHIENSRQTPAYEYPARYGPKAPSFARATLLAHSLLFVSGTAAILGHETVHAGNLDKQWQVAVDNIAHLISADAYTLDDLDYIKVYYRHAKDLPRVMELARAAFHDEANIRYLNVDICRKDLLVEIEGIALKREHRAR